MDIFVSNLPVQAHENALRSFLRDRLPHVFSRPFYCAKPNGKSFAIVTLQNQTDAETLLSEHGSINVPHSKPRRTGSKPQLHFLSRPVCFRKGNKDPDPLILGALEYEEKKREKDEEMRAMVKAQRQDSAPEQQPPKGTFSVSSLSCGVWSYLDTDATFATQLRWAQTGTARFTTRSVIVTIGPHRIDMKYSSIVAIYLGAESSREPFKSLTFTLQEPPHFYDISNSVGMPALGSLLEIEALAHQLSFLKFDNRERDKRIRVPYLDDDHKEIAATCLVYRMTVTKGDNGIPIRHTFSRLQKSRGVPPMSSFDTAVLYPPGSHLIHLIRLKQELAGVQNDLGPKITFQVFKLVMNGYLPPDQVFRLLPEFKAMKARSNIKVCVGALRRMFVQISFPGPETDAYELSDESIIDLLKACEKAALREDSYESLAPVESSENVVVIHRVRITPARMELSGPEPESNNRVLRKYSRVHDYFLRVEFAEEDGQRISFGSKVSNEVLFQDRFKSILRNGFTIGRDHFVYLGFSHSSLRAQTAWFVAPFVHGGNLVLEPEIIRSLGNFIAFRSPARCAARIGQAFSDTPNSVTLSPDVQVEIPDVQRNDRVFSDGVGTISNSVMVKVWGKLSSKKLVRPTCFQIRYGGAKGMVALDSRLQGDVLRLRPSMIKFEGSTSTDLELCGAAWNPLPMKLNSQFIKIFEDLGVPDEYFLDLQNKAIREIRGITENAYNASLFLQHQSVGDVVHFPYLVRKLTALGLNYLNDGFIQDVLEMTILMELRKLKHKNNMTVEGGYHLHGLMDETGILEEGQVFCIVSENGRTRVVTGKDMIITRAPALHPGDVQLANAVEVPADSPLMDLRNCICFSQNGERDLPSQLSGGDLDGDLFYIMPNDRAKLDKSRLAPPANYPRVSPRDIGRTVTTQDMSDHFLKFMETDQLGRICVLHRVLADYHEEGTFHPNCIKLAEMASTAVDYSKTGIPVDLNQLPRPPKCRPDFEAPGPHVTIQKSVIDFIEPEEDEITDDADDIAVYRYYESHKILGRLYRNIDECEIFYKFRNRFAVTKTSQDLVMQGVWDHVQAKCKSVQWEHLRRVAEDIQDSYEASLLANMHEYSESHRRAMSEPEAFIGNLLGRNGAQTRRQRDVSTTLKEKMSMDFSFVVNSIVQEDDGWSEDALPRSIACFAVAMEPRSGYANQGPLMSFKYVAAAVCLREIDRTSDELLWGERPLAIE